MYPFTYIKNKSKQKEIEIVQQEILVIFSTLGLKLQIIQNIFPEIA